MRDLFLKHIKLIRTIVIGITILVILSSTGKIIRSPLAKGDVSVYTHAAEVLLRGENIYATTQIPAEFGGSYYLYLPLLAILFIPFSFLPINLVVVLWCVFNIFLIFWIVKMFYEAMTGTSYFSLLPPERWIIMFFPILLTSRYLLHHLAYGQVNLLVVAMIVLGLKKGRHGNGTLQGTWVGLATVVKITAAPLMLWLFIKDNTRTNIGLAIGLLLGSIVIPSLIVGFGANIDYITYWLNNIVLSDQLTAAHVPGPINTSIPAVLDRLFGDSPAFTRNGQPVFFTIVKLSAGTISILWHAAQIAIVGVIAFYAFRFRKYDELFSRWGGAALAFTMIPLFAPTAQKHYFVTLLPAYVFVIYVWHFVGNKDRWFRGLVIASGVIAGIGAQDVLGKTFADELFAVGSLPLGAILLAAAIFRSSGRSYGAIDPAKEIAP